MTSLPTLTSDELERYARHIVLRDVGGPGQQRLKADRKSTRLNSSHVSESRMPSSA